MHGNDPRPNGHNFNQGLLICLGKKPHSEHTDYGQIFQPESTRPLSIVNTDNRLIANAARLRWERLLNPWISPHQQGFLPQRSMLKNVLDIDYAAMVTAFSHTSRVLVLFDFASAFPSMSQDYMFNMLTALCIPQNAFNMVQALYDNSRCTVQSNGTQVDGFKMTAGVRQGCPLSPLLYAICAELLIERIRLEIPSAAIRAYADDTAVLIQNLWTDASVLARIFTDFGNMFNLRLNLNKTDDTALSTAQLKHDQGQSDKVYTKMGGRTTLIQRTLPRLHTRTVSKRHKPLGNQLPNSYNAHKHGQTGN